MPANVINLTGRVFFTEGVYHCEIVELGILTHDPEGPEAAEMAGRELAARYFDAIKKIPGKFERVMEKFGIKLADLDSTTNVPDLSFKFALISEHDVVDEEE